MVKLALKPLYPQGKCWTRRLLVIRADMDMMEKKELLPLPRIQPRLFSIIIIWQIKDSNSGVFVK
jgi:hypothetical protein